MKWEDSPIKSQIISIQVIVTVNSAASNVPIMAVRAKRKVKIKIETIYNKMIELKSFSWDRI